jgi:hypothetical protein
MSDCPVVVSNACSLLVLNAKCTGVPGGARYLSRTLAVT